MRAELVTSLLAGLALTGACDARFLDYRPTNAARSDGGRPLADGGAPAGDGGASVPDGSAPNDGGAPAELAGGTFAGRLGHSAAGGATLLATSSGRHLLAFDAAFSVTPGPGLRVVLSTRDALGTAIDPQAGDLDLGLLTATSGAQQYELDAPAGSRRSVFIYCRPFGIEFGRALLIAR